MKAVLTFGIYTVDQYARARGKRHLSGASVSYGLLKIGDNPTEQEISRFEDISLIFCTSNGTRRTTCRQRMQDVDVATLELLQRRHLQRTDLLMQDRGASSCLTSAEFAGCLFRAFPCANLEASDRLLWVFRISLAKGKAYIIEPDGEPLQYICPPFVVSLNAYKPERNPLRRIIAAQGRGCFGNWASRRYVGHTKSTRSVAFTPKQYPSAKRIRASRFAQDRYSNTPRASTCCGQ
jgi:hypothetical protein